MKKIVILVLIAFIGASCCKAQHTLIGYTIKGDSIVSIPVTTAPPVMVAPTVDISILNAQEQLFDNIWYVYGSAPIGGEVTRLNTKKGGVDINYHGRTSVPGPSWPAVAMDGKLPIMVDDRSLSFNNRASLQYESNAIIPIAPPYEQWFVFRILPSATYEALFEDGSNRGYVANNGNSIRIINAQYGNLPNSVWPTLYQVHIGRLTATATSASLWIDNVLQGTLQLQGSELQDMSRKGFNVGAITNNADWDFQALYFKAGIVTDPNTLYNSLATKWGAGNMPNQILLLNIGWSKSTAKTPVYTPTANVLYTPSGTTVADPSKWDYEWYYYVAATFLNVQTKFSTKYQITPADFPVGYATMGGFTVKLRMRPKDINGNSWRWFESGGQAY